MDQDQPSPSPPPHRADRDGVPALTWIAAAILAVALLWLLRSASSVFLPLAVGFFLAVAVLPVKEAISRRLPRALGWIGYVVAAGIVIGLLLLFFAGLGIAAKQVAGSADMILPQLRQRLAETPFADLIREGLPQLLEQARGYLSSFISSLGNTLGTSVIIFFLMLLMLIESEDWKKKTDCLSAGGKGRSWHRISEAVGQKFRRYFTTRLILGAITGALYAAWLALFGVPLLLTWAILALLLNFIPTIGSLIAGALPVLFVLALRDLPTALMVGAGILVIEQIMGNYVDPKLTGRQLALSPVVVLVSLLVWTWVWGIAGALISTPMTMLITILFAHVTALRPVALLLSEETDMEGLDRATRPSR